MKKLLFLLLMPIMVFVSCDEVEDSAPIYGAWGIIYDVEGMDYAYKIILDNNTVVIPESADVDYDDEVTSLDRVYVQFEILSSSEIDDDILNSNIVYLTMYGPVKDVVLQADSVGLDTLGNDVLIVYDNSLWQSSNMLNFAYYYQYGYPAKNHNVELVYFPDSFEVAGDRYYFELRHNANDDDTDYTTSALVTSFNMESIAPFQNVSDSVPYTIIINPGEFTDAIERFEGYYTAPSL